MSAWRVIAMVSSTICCRQGATMETKSATDLKLELATRRACLLLPADTPEKRCLDRRVTKGTACMPYPGTYALAEPYNKLNPRAKARMTLKAIHALHPNWTFCSFSAAVAHGLQVPRALLAPVHIAISPTESRRKKPGHVACHTDHGGSRVITDGMPCTCLLQTLLDCLCATGFRYGLAIVDSALHYHLTTHEELARHFADHGKGRRGIRQARQTLAYADGRSENGGESIVRAAIIELGFQTPELQIEIENPMNPGAPKRSDMGWRLSNGRYILVELDGLSKYLSTNARTHEEPSVYQAVRTMRAERLRESHLNLTGATILRLSFAQALDADYLFRLLSTAGVPLNKETSS